MTSESRNSATVAHVDHDVEGNARKPSAQLNSTHSTITTENAIISSQRSSRASVSRYERENALATEAVSRSTTASVASEKRKPTQIPGSSRNTPAPKMARL